MQEIKHIVQLIEDDNLQNDISLGPMNQSKKYSSKFWIILLSILYYKICLSKTLLIFSLWFAWNRGCWLWANTYFSPSTFDVTAKGFFPKVVKRKTKSNQLKCYVNTRSFEPKQIWQTSQNDRCTADSKDPNY